MDLMCRTNLFAASLSDFSTGPSYTYFSKNHQTTVDYCLLDSSAAHLIHYCGTLEQHSLNLSDHLPLTIHLDLDILKEDPQDKEIKLNWKKAISDGSISDYQCQVNSYLSNLLSNDSHSASPPIGSTSLLDDEITACTKAVLQAALDSIPHIKPRKRRKKYINDEILRTKCRTSKIAWSRWRYSGRPRSGPEYDAMRKAKKRCEVLRSLLKRARGEK